MSWKFLYCLSMFFGVLSAQELTFRPGKGVTPDYFRAVSYGVKLGHFEQGPGTGILYTGQRPPDHNGTLPILTLGLLPHGGKPAVIGVSEIQFAGGVADYIRGIGPSTVGFVNGGSRGAIELQNYIKDQLGDLNPIVYKNQRELSKGIDPDGTDVVVFTGDPTAGNPKKLPFMDLVQKYPDVTFVWIDPWASATIPPPDLKNLVIGVPLLDTDFGDKDPWEKISPAANAGGFPSLPAFVGYSAATAARHYQMGREYMTPGIGWLQNGQMDITTFPFGGAPLK